LFYVANIQKFSETTKQKSNFFEFYFIDNQQVIKIFLHNTFIYNKLAKFSEQNGVFLQYLIY